MGSAIVASSRGEEVDAYPTLVAATSYFGKTHITEDKCSTKFSSMLPGRFDTGRHKLSLHRLEWRLEDAWLFFGISCNSWRTFPHTVCLAKSGEAGHARCKQCLLFFLPDHFLRINHYLSCSSFSIKKKSCSTCLFASFVLCFRHLLFLRRLDVFCKLLSSCLFMIVLINFMWWCPPLMIFLCLPSKGDFFQFLQYIVRFRNSFCWSHAGGFPHCQVLLNQSDSSGSEIQNVHLLDANEFCWVWK